MALTERVEQILDAAEKRIRSTGYNGFSFRHLAADVGIKSASVHHHFPTKSELAAAVARRYGERFFAAMEGCTGIEMVSAYREAFRRALQDDGWMCPFGVLAVEADGLPPEVTHEARNFFIKAIDMLASELASHGYDRATAYSHALHAVATFEGAMILARALGDISAFDKATSNVECFEIVAKTPATKKPARGKS